MAFFHSLTLDLKLLVAVIVGIALMALFSGNRNARKQYVVVMAVLAAVGFYRYDQSTTAQRNAAVAEPERVVTTSPARTPLVSTSAR